MTLEAFCARLREKPIELTEMEKKRGGDDEKSLPFGGQHVPIFTIHLVVDLK